MCFWPAKTRTKLDFSSCIHLWNLVLKSCYDIKEGNGYSFLSFPLCWWKKLHHLWEWVFPSLFQVLGWSFLVLHFYVNVCNLIPKVIWPRTDWFWSFSLESGLFVDFISATAEMCMNGSSVCVFFFDDIKTFRWIVWGVFWSVLWMCPFFSAIDFSNIVWWVLSMQSNFTSYNKVSSSVSFVTSIDEITIISSEKYMNRFHIFYDNCQLMFYSVYCNSFFSKNNHRSLTATARWWLRCCRNFFCGWRKLERTWTFCVAFMSWN